MSDKISDAEAELELAEAEATGATQPPDDHLGVPDSPLRKALAAQAGPVVTVDTPTGPIKMTREGGRFLSPEEFQHEVLERAGARMGEEALSTGLSAIHGAANSLTTKVAGVNHALERYRNWGPAAGLGVALHPSQAIADFDQGQEDAARTVDKAVEDHPYANLAGALLMPTPGPGKAKAGVSIATRALTAATPAAAVGALNAFGNTTTDERPGETLGDTVKGAGIGGTVGALLGVSSEGMARAQAWLRNRAEEQALKAFTNPGITNKLAKEGLKPERARQLARWALDNGLVKFGDSAEDIAKRAGEFIDKEGDTIGDVITRADASGKLPDFTEAGTKVLDSINGRSGVALQGRAPVDALAESLANEQSPSFRQLWNAKHDAQQAVNWSTTAKGSAHLLRDATGALRENTYDQLRRVVTPGDAKALADSAARYSQVAKVLPLASDKASRELAKRSGTLAGQVTADRVAGVVGGLPGEIAAEGVVGANRFLSRRGPSMAAKGYDTAQGLTSNLGAPLLDNTTAQADAARVASRLVRRPPARAAPVPKPTDRPSVREALKKPKDEADEEAIRAYQDQ